jgi:Phage integrase, N-terminal SAM-like domain
MLQLNPSPLAMSRWDGLLKNNLAADEQLYVWTKRLRRGTGERCGESCTLGGSQLLEDSALIPLSFRPLWLEFLGSHARKGITMSELRNRMVRDMQLAGLVEGTRREYVRAVRQLAAYYMVSPDHLSERNIENYLLYVRDELGVAKGTFAPIFAGLKFFYLDTLGYDWPLFTKKKSASQAGSGCPTSAVTRTVAA